MEKQKTDWKQEVTGFVKVFVITAVIILLFVNLVAHPVTVVGRSMVPTLLDGEYGFTNILGLKLGGVKRGDVVVVTMPGEDGQDSHWVKRILALPGETIESRNGEIYIDGQLLDEPWLDEAYKQSFEDEYGYFTQVPDGSGGVTDFGPVTLAEDEYFVMGDNRPHSKDSRDTSVGPVKASQLYGKDILVLYPFDKIGLH